MVIPNVRWLNPFVTGALTVLDAFGIEAGRDGSLSVQSSDHTSDPVTVIVPILGALEGAVFYGFDQHSAEQLAGVMIGDMAQVRWNDELVQSALGEFGNMITGRASALLEEQGLRCHIAPPLVALVSRLIVAGHPFDRLIVPLHTAIGRLRIHLAVREVHPGPAG